jgi:hypothetical protein
VTIATISDYSTTKLSNVDLQDHPLAPGTMKPSDVNDTIQDLMVDIASYTRLGADLASAGTLNLDSIDSLWLAVTGTTTVTAVTLTAGHVRMVRATGAFQMTASSTLIVNGSTSVNYTTVAGDLLFFEGFSASTVRVWVIGRGIPMLSTYTQGDIIYASATNVLAKLGIGTARQVARVNSGATAPEWSDLDRLSTASAATSGTSVSQGSIPAGVREIRIFLDSVQTNGTAVPGVQLGDAGGFETTGYNGCSESCANGVSPSVVNTAGAKFEFSAAWAGTAVVSGEIVLRRFSTTDHTWNCDAHLYREEVGITHHFGGNKTLSAELTQVRIIMDGTDAFDGSGTWSVSWS